MRHCIAHVLSIVFVICRVCMTVMFFRETVDTLQKESGCAYQCPRISRLEEVIRSGNMKEARFHLSQLKIPSDIRMACVFLCSQQSFAAALHRNDTKHALEILRG